MNTLIIGCIKSYDWNKVAVWALSIKASGYKGRTAVIQYEHEQETDNDVAAKLQSLGVEVVRIPLRGPIYSQRFLDISGLLETPFGDGVDYVIATDVRDVLFQRDPKELLDPCYLADKDIYAATEGLRYRDESWGKSNLNQSFGSKGQRLMDKPIYNAGVISGYKNAIIDLFFEIYALSSIATYPQGGGGPDQAAYNLLLDMHPDNVRFGYHEDGYAAQLGTMVDPSKIEAFRPYLLEKEPYIENGEVKTNSGKTFCIVHQYDRVPEWDAALRTKINEKLTALKNAGQSG